MTDNTQTTGRCTNTCTDAYQCVLVDKTEVSFGRQN